MNNAGSACSIGSDSLLRDACWVLSRVASRMQKPFDSRPPCNMTPTRTDTTLRQGRRAFKHISLNNTRPRLHSLDATRTTIGPAPHVNNEQESSNTMFGNHTREQIINWVMSKDAVASCFIKDVLSMSESERGGGTRLPT
jgi:hypothetical protein